MKLRKLEMLLQKLSGFSSPSSEYEQYKTPAPVAARLLYTAFLAGDIRGMRIYDPGCGTGILGIGAALLGAREIIGIDLDPQALMVARENAEKSGVDACEFILADIRDESFVSSLKHADTVIMNPPFGAQRAHADRPFLDMALNTADIVYGIFNSGSVQFVRSYTKDRAEIKEIISSEISIPHSFSFHKKEVVQVPVEILVMQKIF